MRMHFSKPLLVDTALVLALILVGVVGYKLSPVLLPKTDVTLTPEPRCDLQQSECGVALPGGGRLSLALLPRPIPAAAPLEASVVLTGIEADGVVIDFAGVDMNMGLNRQALAHAGGGRYAGTVTLPACVTGRMTWQATVLVEAGRQRIAVPFRFIAGH